MQKVRSIKSAERVLEILEYFTPNRNRASVMKIARSMGYPQSSTSELLRCLVALGYLNCDRRERVYWPSARVALLGAWVQTELFGHGNLLPIMSTLSAQTGAAVVLTSRVDIWSQCLHVVKPEADMSKLHTGSREYLTQSPAGKLLLSTLDVEHARKLIHRINADIEPEKRVRVETFLGEIRDARNRKYASGIESDGEGAISVLLPSTNTSEMVTISVRRKSQDLSANAAKYMLALNNAITNGADLALLPPPRSNAVHVAQAA